MADNWPGSINYPPAYFWHWFWDVELPGQPVKRFPGHRLWDAMEYARSLGPGAEVWAVDASGNVWLTWTHPEGARWNKGIARWQKILP